MNYEELNLRLAAAQLKLAEINLEIRDRKADATNWETEEVETNQGQLLDLYQEKDEVAHDISVMSGEMDVRKAKSTDNPARATQPRDSEEIFHDSVTNLDRPHLQPFSPVPVHRPAPILAPPRFKPIAKPSTFKKGDDITLFLDRFRNFAKLGGIGNGNTDLQSYALTLVHDDKLYRLLKDADLSTEERYNVDDFVPAMERLLFPATETRILRSTLASIKQSPGENVADFASRIEELAAKSYSRQLLREEACVSALISGLSNKRIRNKLLEENNSISYRSARSIAVKQESIENLDSPAHSMGTDDFVLAIGSREGNSQRDRQNPASSRAYTPATAVPAGVPESMSPTPRRSEHAITCFGCGQRGHRVASCPSGTEAGAEASTGPNTNWRSRENVTCYVCNRRGHYASSCPQRRNRYNPADRNFNRNPLNSHAAGQPLQASRD